MMNHAFEDFVSKWSETSKKDEIDWQARLNEWQASLSAFYQKVEGFLQPYIKSGKIILIKKSIRLVEDYIGPYEVDALDLSLGNAKITLTPIGTNLIGAKGRVDMRGPKGTVRFVFVPQDLSGPKTDIQIHPAEEGAPQKRATRPVSGWEWKISTPPPMISYFNLVEESFQSALMEVVDG